MIYTLYVHYTVDLLEKDNFKKSHQIQNGHLHNISKLGVHY